MVLFQVNALIGARYYHKIALVVLFRVNTLIGARYCKASLEANANLHWDQRSRVNDPLGTNQAMPDLGWWVVGSVLLCE